MGAIWHRAARINQVVTARSRAKGTRRLLTRILTTSLDQTDALARYVAVSASLRAWVAVVHRYSTALTHTRQHNLSRVRWRQKRYLWLPDVLELLWSQDQLLGLISRILACWRVVVSQNVSRVATEAVKATGMTAIDRLHQVHARDIEFVVRRLILDSIRSLMRACLDGWRWGTVRPVNERAAAQRKLRTRHLVQVVLRGITRSSARGVQHLCIKEWAATSIDHRAAERHKRTIKEQVYVLASNFVMRRPHGWSPSILAYAFVTWHALSVADAHRQLRVHLQQTISSLERSTAACKDLHVDLLATRQEFKQKRATHYACWAVLHAWSIVQGRPYHTPPGSPLGITRARSPIAVASASSLGLPLASSGERMTLRDARSRLTEWRRLHGTEGILGDRIR